MNTENKFLNIVSTYYNKYLDYSKAYKNLDDSREGSVEKIVPLLEKSNSEEQDFRIAAKDYLTMISVYPQEVNFFATKFLHAADLYMLVTGEDLTEEMSEAYLQLKSVEYKSAFSVKDGEFVRNSSVELRTIPDKEYESIFEFLQKEFKVGS